MTTETTITGNAVTGAAVDQQAPPTAKKTRNRLKEDILIQGNVGTEASPRWQDMPGAETFDDAAGALKWLRDQRKVGKFRVIAVKKLVTVEIETKTAVRIK